MILSMIQEWCWFVQFNIFGLSDAKLVGKVRSLKTISQLCPLHHLSLAHSSSINMETLFYTILLLFLVSLSLHLYRKSSIWFHRAVRQLSHRNMNSRPMYLMHAIIKSSKDQTYAALCNMFGVISFLHNSGGSFVFLFFFGGMIQMGWHNRNRGRYWWSRPT